MKHLPMPLLNTWSPDGAAVWKSCGTFGDAIGSRGGTLGMVEEDVAGWEYLFLVLFRALCLLIC